MLHLWHKSLLNHCKHFRLLFEGIVFCAKNILGNQNPLQNAQALLNMENKDAFSTSPEEFTESS